MCLNHRGLPRTDLLRRDCSLKERHLDAHRDTLVPRLGCSRRRSARETKRCRDPSFVELMIIPIMGRKILARNDSVGSLKYDMSTGHSHV